MKKNSKIFATLLLLVFLGSHVNSKNIYHVDTSTYPKVELALYYETLCPYCAKFIAYKLGDIFKNGLISIVDLQLVPWGNAYVAPNGTIICQHGKEECIMNMVEACVIDAWPDVETHFKYIQCFEQKLVEGGQLRSCFGNPDEQRRVEECFHSRGEELLLKHKAKTDNLKPPHLYVPWVVVNNVPTLEKYKDYAKYVCNAYKGPLPPACKSVVLEAENVDNENATLENQVCRARSHQKEKESSTQGIFGRRIKI